MIDVLYVDSVGSFGGASRSLFEAVRALPGARVKPHFLATRGTALAYYDQLSTEILAVRGLTRFDNTRYGYYRRLRWLVLGRELFYAPFSLMGVLAARRRWQRMDIVHANEVLEIGPAILAKRVLGSALVVHVRSVQNADPRSRRYRAVSELLRRHADAVIAIDENVRASLPADLDVTVIHNSFTPKRAPSPDTAMIERLEALRPGALRVGFVGNLYESKGLFEMLGAAQVLAQEGIPVEFVIVGGTTRRDVGLQASALSAAGLAQNVQDRLTREVANRGLQQTFHLMGPTDDIQCVYERMDVICFASHYDAPGRPIFEAAFAGVPSIAAVTTPRSDTLVPHETGIAIPPRDVAALVDAIRYFAQNRAEVRRMGDNARRLAVTNFSPEKNSAALLDLYDRVLDRRSASAGGRTGR